VPASALERADASRRLSDKYDVERVLGRGGMGTVFGARHSRLGHRVAIKMLGEELRVHAELVTRFEREARAAGALSSPHAVKVFDIDQTDDGTPFIVMELLEGSDLAYRVEHDGAQPIGTSVRWVIEACDAIGEAHRLGIIHRDIKPSNLFLCRETGSIKVLDFGIAKRVAAKEAALTLGLAPLGTPQYMSPEQARCATDIDVRTDIWSLGVSLYELVCGRPPFNHDIAQACIVAIVTDPIPDPREFRSDLSDELAEVILRALAKDVSERFQSVDELVLALAPFAEASVAADSWRAVSSARRTVAREVTTVDGSPILELRSRDETAPPTVSPSSGRGTRDKRLRSTVVVVCAAMALGLVAFVPRWAAARLDAVSTANVTPPPQVAEAAVSGTAVQNAVPSKSEETTPRAASPVAARATGSTGPKPPARPLHDGARPASSGSARADGADRHDAEGPGPTLVHGGLSSPGF
jgi:serine/threonine-protein kinase